MIPPAIWERALPCMEMFYVHGGIQKALPLQPEGIQSRKSLSPLTGKSSLEKNPTISCNAAVNECCSALSGPAEQNLK